MAEIVAVEGIHAENVTTWFEENVPGATPPLSFSLITGGRSNLTYKVVDAKQQTYVLRRPPLGLVLESAHNMGREYKIISALGKTDIPVAPALGLCQDRGVNEADFYVMGFVEGQVYTSSVQAAGIPTADRKSLGLNTIETLVQLHRIDPDTIGLGDLGKKEDYVARQVRRWTKQYENTKTDDLLEMEEVGRLLKDNIPVQVGSSIAHGDYRLGNLMVNNNRVAAILDWELCTLGDPLADLGYLLNWWYRADEVDLGDDDDAPTAVAGFPSRDDLISYYAENSGRDVSRINYYRALSYWRLAAIYQGVYKRYVEGVMGDKGSSGDLFITQFKERVLRLSRLALDKLK
ncbi:MAG: phosphotransferase family protein [Deltaproteobacteria bacterium]|jgi:aminoglycoside phosphotransferase (APT) family kinase protein|nr:phosphotransferase family protein [Deltaproteobacteria bacterium]MBT4643598.1 phosphotransferase family protein [Deltaproteobacteria bacterium]MBT6504324.1 phosphotransferase family protein [Deltaproteobacteria bacterium]MBT6611940.1 phosphotransferase family protein [Deltaproteobacteria bacterium]MBT7154159.1 phosphotransferase family protein [Deltaproteobacteria bacterium]